METILYNRIPARVTDLRQFNVNDLTPRVNGKNSGKQRRTILKPVQGIPNKVRQGDFLRIYWGTPPNVYTPDNAFAFFVWVLTGAGEVRLEWDASLQQYVSAEGYTLTYSDPDGWCLDGNEFVGDNWCFPVSSPEESIKCYPFPEDWEFIRLSGPPIDYEIIKYKHQLDNNGHWAYTSIEVELKDIDELQRI